MQIISTALYLYDAWGRKGSIVTHCVIGLLNICSTEICISYYDRPVHDISIIV